MTVYKYNQPLPSEITSKSDYLNRRSFMAGAAGLGLSPLIGMGAAHAALKTSKSPYSTDEKTTALEHVTSYNNFYEFGTAKSDPAKYAGSLTTRPWTIDVGGMVIPWVGIPLASVLKQFDAQGSAKYVAFETLQRPEEMPGQKGIFSSLPWPYVEGLRMDEALHPLTILAVGLYGDILPNQNGAPVRLVVPWKYGFKSIKSIVSMKLTEQEPPTSWNKAGPNEYGFYSNVNPEVSHPRWSQASERIIGGGIFAARKETQFLNGYADEVGSLYEGMDLRKNY